MAIPPYPIDADHFPDEVRSLAQLVVKNSRREYVIEYGCAQLPLDMRIEQSAEQGMEYAGDEGYYDPSRMIKLLQDHGRALGSPMPDGRIDELPGWVIDPPETLTEEQHEYLQEEASKIENEMMAASLYGIDTRYDGHQALIFTVDDDELDLVNIADPDELLYLRDIISHGGGLHPR